MFPRDLRDVGDVRELKGKEIEISGKPKSYNGQTEIVLNDRDLRGKFAKLPKSFDTGRKGSYKCRQVLAVEAAYGKQFQEETDR